MQLTERMRHNMQPTELTEGERIGDLIYAMKKETGKTKDQIASEAGLSPSLLAEWAGDKKTNGVTTRILKKACEYFQCSADYILGLSDIPRVAPDLDMIQKYTGLSFQAIELLHNEKEMTNKKPEKGDEAAKWGLALIFIDFINQFFTSEEVIGESGIIQAIAIVKTKTALIDNGDLSLDPYEAQEYINAGQYKASYEFQKLLERYFKPDIIKAEITMREAELKGFTETEEGL